MNLSKLSPRAVSSSSTAPREASAARGLSVRADVKAGSSRSTIYVGFNGGGVRSYSY